MATNEQLILNRQILAQFLPNQEAIKAFETLFKYVYQTQPEQIDDISTFIATIKQPSTSFGNIENRLLELEQRYSRLNSSLSNLNLAIEELKQMATSKPNLDALVKRIQNLELVIGV